MAIADESAYVRRVLEERAKKLARAEPVEDARETLALVVGEIGSERYGLDLLCVEEIEPLGSLAPVPGTPVFWSGLVNLRGSVFPVLDLGLFLGLRDAAKADGGSVIVVSAAELTIGLAVDAIGAIQRVPVDEIRPPPDGIGPSRDLFSGITSEAIAVLDLPALLAAPALVVDQTSG